MKWMEIRSRARLGDQPPLWWTSIYIYIYLLTGGSRNDLGQGSKRKEREVGDHMGRKRHIVLYTHSDHVGSNLTNLYQGL